MSPEELGTFIDGLARIMLAMILLFTVFLKYLVKVAVGVAIVLVITESQRRRRRPPRNEGFFM